MIRGIRDQKFTSRAFTGGKKKVVRRSWSGVQGLKLKWFFFSPLSSAKKKQKKNIMWTIGAIGGLQVVKRGAFLGC